MNDSESTRTLPVLPIKGTVLYPSLLMPLSVGRERSLAAAEAAAASEDKTLFLVAQRDSAEQDPAFEHLYTIGTEAVIKRLERGDGTLQMIVQGMRRMEIVEGHQTSPYLEARLRALEPPSDTGTEVDALERTIVDLAGRIQAISQPEGQVGVAQILSQFKDPLHKAYLMATMLSLDVDKEQQLLEANTRLNALRLMHEFLTHEAQIAELRQKITTQAQSEMSREQREYLLRQQLRHSARAGRRGRRASRGGRAAPADGRGQAAARGAQGSAARAGPAGAIAHRRADYQITRSYVELILELPWNSQTQDNLDLARARAVLDEDHYDLKEIKQRIVEQLAVLKLNPARRRRFCASSVRRASARRRSANRSPAALGASSSG